MATVIGALPSILTNGTTADATQVMADFNFIVSQVNANAAGIGANSDITSLTGLTTPLSTQFGGTGASAVGSNLVFAGPVGASSVPTFRSLVAADFSAASANRFLGGPATGSTATPTFRNLAGPDGAYAVLLGTVVAASNSAIQFTGIQTNSYQKLILELSGLVGSTSGGNYSLQVGVGAGPTWNVSTSYDDSTFFTSGGSLAVTMTSNSTGIQLISSTVAATAPSGGTFKVDMPGSTTLPKRVQGEWANCAIALGQLQQGRSGGMWLGDNSALSALMVFYSPTRSSTANTHLIAAGTAQLWGVVPA